MQSLIEQASLNSSSTTTYLSRARSIIDSRNFARIWIDGYEIGGYLTYTALDAKSYFTEPKRSINGVIENLNSYATFLTPQVTLEFKYMDIRTYRIIMKLIQQRNEHVVKYYDIVNDKLVTKKMYFKPEQLPTIFSRKLEILAVTDYKLELVGTNAELSTLSIIYHANYDGATVETEGSADFVSGEEIIIGEGITIKDNAPSDKHFNGWNSSADGTGQPYLDGYAYVININDTTNNVLNLYAQWVDNNTYTLSYNYGLGETFKSLMGAEIINKEITINDTYGTLPTTKAQSITYNGEVYYGDDSPYYNPQWYMNPVVTPTSTQISEKTQYTIQGNSTIYQIFQTKKYKIHFDLNVSISEKTNPDSYSDIEVEYGAAIYKPQSPTRDGYTFDGWYTSKSPSSNDLAFVFSTMPPNKNSDRTLTLYAKWVKNEG